MKHQKNKNDELGINAPIQRVSHKHVGSKVLAKIKIYILIRAELFFLFAMRYPVSPVMLILESFQVK